MTTLGRRLTALAVVLFILGLLALLGQLYFNPPDRVRVSVINIPDDVYFVSLAAATRGKLQTMHWSVKKIVVGTMHPTRCTWSYHPGPSIDWSAYVKWQSGEKYGVVTRTTDRVWRVTWFEANALPICGRVIVLGGGTAYFDMSKGRALPLLPEEVKDLCLEDVSDPD
jgi:hypothetical protein